MKHIKIMRISIHNVSFRLIHCIYSLHIHITHWMWRELKCPLVHALTQALPKQKRANLQTNNASNNNRRLRKRLEMNWLPNTFPENGQSKFDFTPPNLEHITPDRQMNLLQLLLRMKSQGIRIPEVAMDMVINLLCYKVKMFV